MNRKFSGLLTVLITACLCQAWFFTSFAYVFETEGIEISMNQDASQVLSELGKVFTRRTVVPTRERNGYLLTMDLSFPLILPGAAIM